MSFDLTGATALLQNNQFASGGLLMVVVGSVLAYMRSIPATLLNWIKKQVIVSMDITNDDPVFEWISVWLEGHPYNQRARRLTVASRRDSYGYINSEEGNNFFFSPSAGNHVFFHKGRIFWMSRNREKLDTVSGSAYSKMNRETIELRTIGRSQKPLRKIVDEAYNLIKREKVESISVYSNSGSEWNFQKRIQPRSLETVYLPDSLSNTLVNDITQFISDEAWYRKLGIPFRRGYLLHGVPGSGKTSTVKALAGKFKMNIYILNLSGDRLTDSMIEDALSTVPPKSIVLLEDIDSIFHGRDRDASVEGGITFKGLLNALDGVSSSEGTLLFITTNHVEKLDAALIRPGRVDLQVEFTNAQYEQIVDIARAFYPGIDEESSIALGVELSKRRVSMAQVQNTLMKHRDNYREVLQ